MDEATSCTANQLQATNQGGTSMLQGTFKQVYWEKLGFHGMPTSIFAAHLHSSRTCVTGYGSGAFSTGKSTWKSSVLSRVLRRDAKRLITLRTCRKGLRGP